MTQIKAEEAGEHQTKNIGAAAGIRTRVPGCFLTGWEAGVIDQGARQQLYFGNYDVGSGPRPPARPTDSYLVSIFAQSK